MPIAGGGSVHGDRKQRESDAPVSSGPFAMRRLGRCSEAGGRLAPPLDLLFSCCYNPIGRRPVPSMFDTFSTDPDSP